jgi:transcriptional regulator with XRE-family HTH domain
VLDPVEAETARTAGKERRGRVNNYEVEWGPAIGKALREVRQSKGMSQGDIIKEMRKNGYEVERSSISQLETGKVNHPRFETISKLTQALGIRLGCLVMYVELRMKIPWKVIVDWCDRCLEEIEGADPVDQIKV